MLKKILFVSAVLMMLVVGCAGSVAVEVINEIDHNFEAEIIDALHLPEEMTVTKRINGDTVYSERVETRHFDEDGDHELRFGKHDEVNIDDITNIDWNWGDDGVTFELEGTNRDGEDVTISADLTNGNNSTINIDITD